MRAGKWIVSRPGCAIRALISCSVPDPGYRMSSTRLRPISTRSWRGGWATKPICVLDLSGVPVSILTNLVGAMRRIVYDALLWARKLAEGGRERPLLLVLEEAHAYLSASDGGPAASAVRRIAKEGRKYGIGAMIVSQRPAEIDSTILSQCGTIVAMRLSNSSDRGHVTSTVSDNLEGLLASLPILRTGEAIIVGEAVQLPVRVLIEPPADGRYPDSRDPRVVEEVVAGEPVGPGGWNRARSVSDYKELVQVWRAQQATSPRVAGGNSSMERTPVDSRTIVSIGYDASTQTLEVEFTNGNVYQYFDVPSTVHEELMTAESKGAFLNAQIKGSFRYARS
jgi:hypothetical protein